MSKDTIAKRTVHIGYRATKKQHSGQNLIQVLLNVVLGFGCIIAMLPFMWIISTSLRSPAYAFRMPPLFLPTEFMYQNYVAVFESFPFIRFISNSLLAASGSVLLSVTVTTLAAYAFARINFRFKNAIFIIFMSGLMVPGFATLISTFLMMSQFNLVNTLWALILPAAINPLHIFLVRQFMMTIPKSYDESAEIDGCSRFSTFFFIILPMTKPVLMLAVLQAFLASWNDFMRPLIFLHDFDRMTIPIGLRMLHGFMGTGNLSYILAGVTISFTMPVILYIFGQRYLVEGITLTGVKS